MAKRKAPVYPDFERIITLIHNTRDRVVRKVNQELVQLYYSVGQIVSHKVQEGEWGKNTVGELADYIQNAHPKLEGFTRRGLYRMKQFYETYSDPKILEILNPIEENKTTQITLFQGIKFRDQFVSTVLTQINWSSHLEILSKTDSHEQRLFYLQLAINEQLSVRDIKRQLDTGSYERTLLAHQFVSTPLTQFGSHLFKDPYVFEFLNLKPNHTENDLELAIIANLQKFILEIGKGFTYMGRQYRLQVGNRDFFTDLLFYHRDLQCMVLFELKLEDFQPEFLGKLNFYLEALDRKVKKPHENPSIGVLLCRGKDKEVVEFATARYHSPTVIADFETQLIDKEVLVRKLGQLIEMLTNSDSTPSWSA